MHGGAETVEDLCREAEDPLLINSSGGHSELEDVPTDAESVPTEKEESDANDFLANLIATEFEK